MRESKYDVKEEAGGGDGEVEVSGESVEDMLRAWGRPDVLMISACDSGSTECSPAGEPLSNRGWAQEAVYQEADSLISLIRAIILRDPCKCLGRDSGFLVA